MGSDDETARLSDALGAQAAAAGAALDALAAATRGELAAGAVIGGRFEVLRTLGAGGMGVVYAAYDPTLDRRVAVKVVRAVGAAADGGARLIREARAVATVSHANVIVVYDVGSTADGVFIAMEYLDGGTLREWLATPRPRAAIVARFLEAGSGLAAAHAAGLVHRDFKPDNVLLGRDGRVRVADFGLARRAGSGDDVVDAAASPDGLDPATRLTQAGAIVGTPAYMSPEQLAGAELDARSDQFAFAVALYQALYREHPFAAVGVRSAPVVRPPPAGADVPERLRAVLVRALAADRAARFPSMAALLAALDDRPRRRRRWVALAAVAAIGGAVAGALAFGGHRAPAAWAWSTRRTIRRST
ncbi:MAG: serine/threonine protein kinase, partial [Myxococcales bacterium]|nr:serine/threonine protein kinase [Myxococcales bacterium]